MPCLARDEASRRIGQRREAIRAVWPDYLGATGIGTVLYWRFSQTKGAENVLPYVAFQVGAIVAGMFLVRFFPPAYSRETDLLLAAALYAAAALAEFFDAAIFAIGRMVSGPTLMHLLAALAVYQLVRMLRARSPIWGAFP